MGTPTKKSVELSTSIGGKLDSAANEATSVSRLTGERKPGGGDLRWGNRSVSCRHSERTQELHYSSKANAPSGYSAYKHGLNCEIQRLQMRLGIASQRATIKRQKQGGFA